MRKWLVLLLIILFAGCRQSPPPTPPVASTAVSPTATTTPIPADVNQSFLPLASGGGPATAVPTLTPTIPTTTPPPDYPIYDGPPIPREQIGVQIHIHREDLDDILDQLRDLGVGWVKVQVSWKLYQPYPDQYAADRFAELDALVEKAAGNRIAVLLNVSKAPEWSRPTTEMDGPPLDFALYREFMAYLAGRYRGQVAAYELWNESNLQREWNGRPLSAADVVALMRAGADGARAADPAALLISGAPATTGINDGLIAIDDRQYLGQMLAAGVVNFVDAIGVHPYGWANPPDSSANDPAPSVPSHNDHPSFFFKDTLVDYAELLAAAGAPDKPLWVTEFGWGSFDGLGAPPPDSAPFMAHVSEWQQAVYILRAYELAQTWETVGPLILWNLNFGPLLGEDFNESGYSLLRPDGSRRPAFRALAQFKFTP